MSKEIQTYEHPTPTLAAVERLNAGKAAILASRNAIVTPEQYKEWNEEAKAIVVYESTLVELASDDKSPYEGFAEADPRLKEWLNSKPNYDAKAEDCPQIWTSTQYHNDPFTFDSHLLRPFTSLERWRPSPPRA